MLIHWCEQGVRFGIALRAFLRGLEECVGELVRHVKGRGAHAAGAGDRHLAEDVTQAVFLLPRKKAGDSGKSGAGGWLYKGDAICVCECERVEARRYAAVRRLR